MWFLSILDCAPSFIQGSVRSPAPTTAMGAATKAGAPAGRKAAGSSAVIKAVERAGVCSWLGVKTRRPVEGVAVVGVSVVEIGVVKIAVIKVAVVEVTAIDDRSAVGDVGVVVVDRAMATPVVPPVTPAPAKPSQEPNPKPTTT